MRKRWGADNVLKTTYWEGAWPRQIWGGEICGGFCGGILSLQAKGFRWWKISARFSLSLTTVQWDPRKSPWISPFQNLFLTEIKFHGNFVCVRFSLQISPATFFATNFAGKMFRRHQFFAGTNFSPAPFFRRRQFSPAAFFAALTLHAGLKTPTRRFCLLFKKASKAAPSYLYAPSRYWWKFPFLFVYHDHHNRNCMSTTHSNFRILQLKFFAGVSLCRLVATSFHSKLSQNA